MAVVWRTLHSFISTLGHLSIGPSSKASLQQDGCSGAHVWGGIPAPALSSCVSLDLLPNLSVPQFPSL